MIKYTKQIQEILSIIPHLEIHNRPQKFYSKWFISVQYKSLNSDLGTLFVVDGYAKVLQNASFMDLIWKNLPYICMLTSVDPYVGPPICRFFFSVNIVNVFSLPDNFLNNIFYSLTYFLVIIPYVVHITYKMCVSHLFIYHKSALSILCFSTDDLKYCF